MIFRKVIAVLLMLGLASSLFGCAETSQNNDVSETTAQVTEETTVQIEEEVKHKRFDRLKELVESQLEENNKKYIGTIQKVIVEGTSKNNDKMLSGRTDSNKVVIFEGEKELIGTVQNLEILSEHMWYLKGER